MYVYKIKFHGDDLRNKYLLDVEVLGRSQEQAVQMASQEARKFLCSGRIDDVEQIGRRIFLGKPKVLKVSKPRHIPKP